MKKTERKILLVGEYPPPFAGIGVQTKHLYELFVSNNIPVSLLSTSNKITGFFYYINKLRFVRGIVNLLQFIFSLRKIKHQDIVHILASSGLNFYIFFIPALGVSKLFNKKTIIHYHGGGAQSFFKKKNILINIFKKLTDSLVVPSGYLQDVFNEIGINSIIIPNAIDLNKFKFHQRQNIRPNILSVRNFTSTYNISCTLRAFKILHSYNEDAKLIIAGDGPEKESLITLAKNLGISKAVKFEGNIPNNKMSSLYRMSDILINSSNVDNMPVSILEAQAMGLVVITTTPGGIPYIIKDGVNGFTADINDHNKLGEKLISAVNNQKLSKQMILHGLNDVKNMDSQLVLKKWTHLYQSM